MTSTLPQSPTAVWKSRLLNWSLTVASVCGCLFLLPVRVPGMELLGVTPNWLLIWVVAWSVKRSAFQGAVAGLVLGLLQDAMTADFPTHTLGLVIVGVLTGQLQKQRFIQEDIVSVALIVFGMAVIAETAMAVQISLHRLFQPDSLFPALSEIWLYHQRISLSSAILSSVWAPALYYPLNRWWQAHGLPDAG
ncbi:hypothetical protein XM38_000320 [Halomicronema hongdechloris C2206]|uniref:Uncharacterized protein n=1 Tax=Halomicronema hongdechloris C2206 TaxID=1641165 RepID=A0A1Z3HFQ0_9CYAN|nr:rod shape-determining protein MreD [Halomicronema hongdechloris]ASC69106.1 hypothetical protein XM38_000320 [Halomicronema hongdechloris C2206]